MDYEQPWYRRIHRWGQTNLTEDDPAHADLDFWKAQWKRTRIQGIIVNCGGIVAYYPSKYPLQYRAQTLGDGDFFRKFSDAAAEAGLVVVARMDISRATEEFLTAHPDWFCRDREGRPIASQGRYFTCVNSDYYKQYVPGLLTEIIEAYHPVGFADNSWKGLSRETICYCDNCRKMFREQYGLPLPERADYADPVYREWIRWSYDCRTENWDLFNGVTKRAGGEHCLWFGMLNADPANPSGSFVDLKALCERSEYIFCDHQGRDMLNGFEQNSVNGALLRLASREDVIVAESIANYVRGRRTFRLTATPAPEARLWMAAGAAGGISPWFHHIGAGTRDRRQFETPVPFFNWHAENEGFLYDRRSLAKVALLWSRDNVDFYGCDKAQERVALPWRGFMLALSQGRIPFLPLNADHIARYADRIRTLILPDLAVLTDAQADEILAHLDRGGNLVLTGLAGSRDCDGLPRAENSLLRRLGLRLTGMTAGASGKPAYGWEHYETHNYLALPAERHPVLKGFEDTDIIGFGGSLPIVQSEGPLRPVSGYIPPFPIYPPEFSWVREVREDMGTVFAGQLPSGSRVVYFAADMDRCFGRDQLPDHGRLLENAVRWATGDALAFEVRGEGHIDASLYEQGRRRIAHLVNLSGCNLNPGYCTGYLPVSPVSVTMPSAPGAMRARLLVSGKMLPVTVRNGLVTVEIEKVVDHEVVVVE